MVQDYRMPNKIRVSETIFHVSPGTHKTTSYTMINFNYFSHTTTFGEFNPPKTVMPYTHNSAATGVRSVSGLCQWYKSH